MFDKIKKHSLTLGAVALFIALAFIYFSPVIEGRFLPQMDNTQAIGMARELVTHYEETGEVAQWTNSMFGGMPSFQIKGDASANLFNHLNHVLRLGLPYHTVAILFLYLFGFFLLLRSMGFSHWLSIIGSIAFGFGSYNFIIIIAGHITKAYAIALMAPVIGGILYTYNKNKWDGALFTMVALGTQIAYNHVQITYYLAILVLILGLDKLSRAIASNTTGEFLKRTGLLVAAAVLAILPNTTKLWTTYDYGQESIRGKTSLVEGETTQRESGLDADYAFMWSYGVSETLTLLIPNFKGGASEPIGANEELIGNVDERIRQSLVNHPKFWGDKPFTKGPVYAGAFICFLFVLGLFIYKGREKWWLLGGTLISFMLAWGHNLEWFNMMMFNHFPLYNKFRTVEMALVIASFTIPFLALLALKEIIENPKLLKDNTNAFLAALGLTGGVALVFYLFPGILNFLSPHEVSSLNAQKLANPAQAAMIDLFIQELQEVRATLLQSDAFRSLVFIALGSGSLWFFAMGRLSAKYLLPALLILVLVDLWGVDRRYLNNEHFVPAREGRQLFTPTPADNEILSDKDLHFRVFSIFRNSFNEVHTSYFHSSIGGYHGAKLRRYQDIIDRYLQPNATEMINMLRTTGDINALDEQLSNMPAINMLNTRYIVFHPEMSPFRNPHAMGNAWTVSNIHVVNSYKEEIDAIATENLTETAIVHAEYLDFLQNQTLGLQGGVIELTYHSPEIVKYKANLAEPRLAVFSEIYYPRGWKAFINGNEVPIIRANHVLRALLLPAGESSIEFRFEPASFHYGMIVSGISSILIVLLIIGYAIYKIKLAKRASRVD